MATARVKSKVFVLLPLSLITPQYRLSYYWYLDPARQEEFVCNRKSAGRC